LKGRQRASTADHWLIVAMVELYFINENSIQSQKHFLLADSNAYAISALEGWQNSTSSPISEKSAGIAVPTNGLLGISYKLVYLCAFQGDTYCYLVVIAATKQHYFEVEFLFVSNTKKVLGLQTEVVVYREF